MRYLKHLTDELRHTKYGRSPLRVCIGVTKNMFEAAAHSPDAPLTAGVRSPLAGRPAMLRSARTNNPLRMPGVKSHSADGRRFRDLMRAYSEPLGGLDALGAADIALVREAVSKTMLSEAMAGSLARGEAVDAEQATRVGNTLSRLLRQLEHRAKALAPKPQSLLAVLAEGAR